MALFDFLKRKKEIEKSRKSEKKAEKVLVDRSDKKTDKKTETPKVKTEPAFRPKGYSATAGKAKFSYDAVNKPHISEKATYLSEKDQYVFEVSPRHNKNEVKKAVEGIYGVNVLSVNVIKIPAKKRRLGKTQGFRRGYKKAIVKIKEGQKIEIL